MKDLLKLGCFSLIAVAFVACQSGPNKSGDTAENVETAAAETDKKSDMLCFQLTESEAGRKTVTFISLFIEGDRVTGEEAVEMTGGENNAVGAGTLSGKKVGDVITVDFSYEIEGSKQVEEQEFKLADGKLLMTHAQLEEMGGKLVLAEKGLFNKAVPAVDCP